MRPAITMPWTLRRLMRRTGLPGAVALALLLAVIAFVLLGLRPLALSVDEMQGRFHALPAEPDVEPVVVTPAQALQSGLEAFRSRFPRVDELSDQLDTLFELAAKHQLSVDKGEYALVEKAGGNLRRFEVTLPVNGTYPQIRALLHDVLSELQAAALKDLTLERVKVGDGRANATLHLVFFVRKGA